ncbi:DUF4190 domain-containing protein [Raoultibacter phocaeensis]|uniref:DUF4190 domain-containing protein n=1 Tax=Raoultibacter phocaeensis TaxID=2479841 RepID=UPI0011182A97|nr:DUF4190 domain-containing protein [Raoultibacter phocaeensis]
MAEENNVNPSGVPEQPPTFEPVGADQAAAETQPVGVPEPPAPGQTAQYMPPQQPGVAPEPPAPGQYTAAQQPTQAMPNGYQSQPGYQAQPGQQPTMGYGYPAGYGAPQPPTAAPTGPGSGKALGALICGICAIVFSWTVIIGVILGIVAIVLASQYVKSYSKDGKATGGKVCGIVGIVFSIFALIGYIGFGMLVNYAVNEYSSTPTPSYSYDSGSSSDSSSTMPTDADEQAAIDAASAVLDELKNPTAADINALAAGLDEGFASESGLESLSEIGVDPTEFATWLLSDLSYEIDDAFVYSDGTGTVYADVTTKNYYEFMTIFETSIDDFLASAEASSITDEAAANAKIGELVKDAMDKTGTTVNFAYIDVKKVGGTWVVDDDSLEEVAQSIFGIYY